MGVGKVATVSGIGIAALSGLAWALKRFLRSKDYDDLDSVVSFSSRLVAGMRAYEGKEKEPLVSDPLAELLAGRRGMQAAATTLKHYEDVADEKAVASKADRKFLVGRVALRTLFYDDHLLAACKAGARQVVLLGAGMDSRAWRLDLPEGISWFEIDRADVLNAKRKVLTKAQASFSVDTNKGAKYPLRAAIYKTCDVDLGSEGWTKHLIAAGFDPKVPTVWVAEGLLMYLSEAAVTALLKEARSVSVQRSRFLIMAFTSEDVVKWYQECATQTPVAWVKELAVTFKSSFPKDPQSYVEERGWHAESVESYSALADKYAHGLPWTSTPGLMANLGLTGRGDSDTNTAFIDTVPF
ncbi:Putative S-adenosyl-L-methionine-dependent methyltransferase [Coccomyxa sp. Obi]|nr:Putative S-adenosyl-L-methionine-dependent methyltransferase [Coccomyxa sp. Obi]